MSKEISEKVKKIVADHLGVDEAKVVDDSKLVTQEDVTNILQADICPECPEAMVYEEGCQKCYSCGYSKC